MTRTELLEALKNTREVRVATRIVEGNISFIKANKADVKMHLSMPWMKDVTSFPARISCDVLYIGEAL